MFPRLTFIFIFLGAWAPVAGAQSNAQLPAPAPAVSAASTIPTAAAVKPPDEVTLEVNVVQIILNDEHRSGVDWGAIVSDFNTAPLKKANDPLWTDKKYRLSFGTLTQDDYEVLLDALDMAGQVSQFPQDSVKITAGAPSSVNYDKQNIRVGLLLSRLKSGDLALRLTPNIDIAATEIFDGEKVPASVLLQAETRVIVANGTTVVIGGFMKEEQIKKTHKFPLLGDIPIVGLVFRSHGRLMQKTETVIFLTARTNAVQAPAEDDDTL